MKKLTDEQIQRLLEGHVIIEPDDEVLIYQTVYRELSKLPDVSVDNLAQEVMVSVQNNVERKTTIKTYLAVAVSLTIAFLFLLSYHFPWIICLH
ncbi:hypothetical protein INP83_11275 [Mucilaginibacter sp. 21P]|uniref:hypothetical protein n=1 Tax=Mucilaginibacter sp. 21P TaxID=2778902 RepID=UPI001C55AFE9|nr:hypothetical protein [Mucilaginibacter sp. 21P]QXV63692.1 hypothetical protein INP83_11275 [Mucilaginibacter sp. 21P]